MTDLSHRAHRVGDTGVREALRAGLGFAAAGVAFLVLAAIWIGTCSGATMDPVACGAPQRTALVLGAPAILLGGGVWSLTRALRVRRGQPARWAWSGVGCALAALALLSALMQV